MLADIFAHMAHLNSFPLPLQYFILGGFDKQVWKTTFRFLCLDMFCPLDVRCVDSKAITHSKRLFSRSHGEMKGGALQKKILRDRLNNTVLQDRWKTESSAWGEGLLRRGKKMKKSKNIREV